MSEETDLKEFIETIQMLTDRISNETDLGWTNYNTSEELKTKINTDLIELQSGNMDKLFELKILFAPTGIFQELSFQNGWEDEYLDISARMDELYVRIKPLKIIKKKFFGLI